MADQAGADVLAGLEVMDAVLTSHEAYATLLAGCGEVARAAAQQERAALATQAAARARVSDTLERHGLSPATASPCDEAVTRLSEDFLAQAMLDELDGALSVLGPDKTLLPALDELEHAAPLPPDAGLWLVDLEHVLGVELDGAQLDELLGRASLGRLRTDPVLLSALSRCSAEQRRLLGPVSAALPSGVEALDLACLSALTPTSARAVVAVLALAAKLPVAPVAALVAAHGVLTPHVLRRLARVADVAHGFERDALLAAASSALDDDVLTELLCQAWRWQLSPAPELVSMTLYHGAPLLTVLAAQEVERETMIATLNHLTALPPLSDIGLDDASLLDLHFLSDSSWQALSAHGPAVLGWLLEEEDCAAALLCTCRPDVGVAGFLRAGGHAARDALMRHHELAPVVARLSGVSPERAREVAMALDAVEGHCATARRGGARRWLVGGDVGALDEAQRAQLAAAVLREADRSGQGPDHYPTVVRRLLRRA